MPTLREANDKFCQGAAEIWYIWNIKGKKVFTQKVPYIIDPLRQGIMRTIRFKAPGEYLMVMDIDGLCLTQDMLDVAARVWDGSPEDERPLVKDSGNKGLQLIWKVIFPHPVEESKAVKLLELLAWEKYNAFDFESSGISFGPPGTDKPHVDTSMFERNRKIRGFCTRFNGKFSVPLNAHDDLWTAELRRSLVDVIPDFEIGTIVFQENMLTLDRPEYYWNAEREAIAGVPVDFARVSVGYRDLFNRLPKYMKALSMYEGDPHHNRKRWLVWYLFRMGLSPDEVIDFIWNTCKWSDLNSLETTARHVKSLHGTYVHIIAENGSFTFPEFVFD